MQAKSRQQANDGMRDTLARLRKIVILGGLGVRQRIDAARCPMKKPLLVQPSEIHSGNPVAIEVAGPHDSYGTDKVDQCLSSCSWHVSIRRLKQLTADIM